MAQPYSDRSVTGILADLLMQFTTLLRTESELARAEITEKITSMGRGLVMIVAGAVLLMPALVILMEAGVTALEQTGLEPYWSALAVGGGVLIVGLILASIGVSRLNAKRLVPNKTIHQLQEDAAAAKRQARSEHDYQRAA
jgi:Putative Actinobacterial Holin-X, holin superfamily III